TLLALFGPKQGVRLELEGETVLGRSSEADLQLIDAKVSRQHCRFVIEGGELRVEDLGSQNGTYVNGARLESARRLQAGGGSAVGDSLFVVDGAGGVGAARLGAATLVIAPGAPAAGSGGEAPAAGRAEASPGAVAALGAALRGCRDLESAARAVLAA